MTAPVASRPVADVRALGAGTTIRFVQLVVLLLVSTVSIVSFVAGAGVLTPQGGIRCALAAGVDPNSGDLYALLGPAMDQRAAYQACLDRDPAAPLWALTVIWPALVVVAAVLLFWGLPAWKGRRGRVVPVAALDGDGELRDVLAGMVAVAGLARAPRFVVDPAAATTNAVVFGAAGRHTVCLHGGLVARRRADPEGFRAVVLHELAHIRNKDVGITYATVALWRVFATAVLLPYALWVAQLFGTRSDYWPAGLPILSRDLVLTAFMAMLVYLARCEVLRSREIYADLDAVRWGAQTDRWHAHTGTGRGLSSFAGIWRTHPRWGLRRQSLTDPAFLFGLQGLPMFLTGAVAAIMEYQSMLVPAFVFARVPVVWLIAALVTGVVGVSAWRAAAYAVLTSRPVPTGIRAGLWLGAGFIVGGLVSNQTLIGRWVPAQPEVLLVPVFAMAVIVWWTAECARLWAGAWRGRTPRPVMLLGLVATWSAFAALLSWWDGWGFLFGGGRPYATADTWRWLEATFPGPASAHRGTLSAVAALWPSLETLVSTRFAPTVWAATALWTIPLLAWTIRPRTRTRRWAAFAAAAPETRPGEQVPRRRILTAGMAGGVTAWIGVLAVMAWLHPGQPPPGSPSERYELVFEAWALLIIVAAGTIAAVVVSLAVTRPEPLGAYIAAQVTALTALAGMFVIGTADGCLGPFNTIGHQCHLTPQNGWLTVGDLLPLTLGLTLVTSSVVVLLAVVVQRRPRRVRSTKSASASRRPHVAPLVALVVLALGLTAAVEVPEAVRTSTAAASAQAAAGGLHLRHDEAVTATSARLRGLQVYAWLSSGGLDLIGDLGTTTGRVGTALRQAGRGAHAGKVGKRVFAPLCANVEQATRRADGYFRIPDPALQPAWRRILLQARSGSRDCRRAFADSDQHLFFHGINEMTKAVNASGRLLTRLDAVLAAATRDGKRTGPFG